jgi:predicted DNA-binding transcriptional regulator AlpA
VSKKNAIAKAAYDVGTFDGAGARPLGRLLTVQEVAAILRCSISSLNKWRLTGLGPKFVRVGSRVRYRLAEVEAYVAQQTRQSTSSPEAA